MDQACAHIGVHLQSLSRAALDIAFYLLSVVDSAVMRCSFEKKASGPSAKKAQNADVEQHWSSLLAFSPHQSASLKIYRTRANRRSLAFDKETNQKQFYGIITVTPILIIQHYTKKKENGLP